MKNILKKHFFLILFFILLIIQSVLIDISDVLDRDFRYIHPLPAYGYSNTFILYFGGVLLFPIVYYLLRNKRNLQLSLSALLCVAMAISTGMYAYRVVTGYDRINNISNERFEIKQINLSQIEEYEAGNYRKIIMVGKAGCGYCQDVYREVDDLRSNFPLSVNYYDCYIDRNNSEELDKMLSKYGIELVPAFIIMNYEDFSVIPCSPDMVQQLENHVMSCADNNFYYTDF